MRRRLRPNNTQGHGSKIRHGFLGKMKTYTRQDFDRLPELSEEERRQKLVDNLKPYSFDPKKMIPVDVAHGPIGSTPAPTSTPTPTPSPTPPELYYILAENTDPIITENDDNVVVEAAPAPSPSPTPTTSVTPSVTPTFTPTPSTTPPFNPSNISGLHGWYDFSDSGNTSLSGSEILTAYDLSSAGVDLISPGGARPVLSASTINTSLQSAVFTRSGAEYLYNTTFGATTPSGYTWFMVGYLDVSGITGERLLLYLYDNVEGTTYATNYYNYGGEDRIRTQYPGAQFDGYTGWSKYPRFLMWNQQGPGSPYNTYDAELNDTTYNSAIADTTNFSGIDLFYISLTSGIDMVVGEVIFYDRQLNGTEIGQVETYLKNKWDYTNW